MFNNKQLEAIDRMRIHELRDYARKLGIQSPTTLRKGELLKRIGTIISENDLTIDDDPNLPAVPSEMGFKEVLVCSDPDVVEAVIKNAVKELKKKLIENEKNKRNNPFNNFAIRSSMRGDGSYSDAIRASEELELSVSQDEADYEIKSEEREGYLDIHEKGYGIVRVNNFVPDDEDVYLTLSAVNRYALKKGDYIKGRVKLVYENSPKLMCEIISIDGNPYGQSPNFNELPYKQLDNEFKVDKYNLDIKKGDRIYCNFVRINDAMRLAKDIADQNNTCVKFVNLNARPEEFCDSTQKITVINCPFNRPEEDLIKTIELVVERLKREFENDKSNVLFIYNFSEMVRAFNIDSDETFSLDKFNIRGISRVKQLLYSAKYTSENKHISIICVDREDIPNDLSRMMESMIMNLFTSKYSYKNNSFIKKDN